MPSGQGGECIIITSPDNHTPDKFLAGTNPIHNKKPKKKQTDEDDEDKAFKAKQQAGKPQPCYGSILAEPSFIRDLNN